MKSLVLTLAAAMALAIGAGHAQAADTYRITAGGNQDWGPGSGAVNQTSSDTLVAADTMTGDSQNKTFGHADYEIASGPGITRAKLSGGFTTLNGLAYPSNPQVTAVSTTDLIVAGPEGTIKTSLNVHVDGTISRPVCDNGGTVCGAVRVLIGVDPGGVQTAVDVTPDGAATVGTGSTLGLTVDTLAAADGYRVHGDVAVGPFVVTANQAFSVTISLQISVRITGGGTFAGNFDDPPGLLQASFAPIGPVLNDVPAGYTVSGKNVVDNRWTDPFAPASGDIVVTSCSDPALAALTTVNGNRPP